MIHATRWRSCARRRIDAAFRRGVHDVAATPAHRGDAAEQYDHAACFAQARQQGVHDREWRVQVDREQLADARCVEAEVVVAAREPARFPAARLVRQMAFAAQRLIAAVRRPTEAFVERQSMLRNRSRTDDVRCTEFGQTREPRVAGRDLRVPVSASERIAHPHRLDERELWQHDHVGWLLARVRAKASPRIVERGAATGAPPFMVDKARAITGPHMASVRRAVAAGVPIVFGTDAGAGYYEIGDFADELRLMGEAGMSATAILRAATAAAASACRIDHLTGSLKPGLAADILVVRGDATADAAALAAVELVFRDGAPVFAATAA